MESGEPTYTLDELDRIDAARESHVYAMVNCTNGLPVLVWAQYLPDLADPPAQRGRRLLIEAMTARWEDRPESFPWVKAAEDIPRFVDEGYRLAEVPEGFFGPDGTRYLFDDLLDGQVGVPVAGIVMGDPLTEVARDIDRILSHGRLSPRAREVLAAWRLVVREG